MKINDDHMYHGAALTQIAEHPKFSTINAFKVARKASRSSFVIKSSVDISSGVGIFIKYSGKPTGKFQEYGFTFVKEHFKEIDSLAKKFAKVYVVLVCVKDREICCISNEEFQELIGSRKQAKGVDEDFYTLLVTAYPRKKLRVYVNVPETKGKKTGEKLVSRNSFPSVIFE